MNLNENFPVSPGKIEALKERIARLKINLNLVEEQFTRGGGKGGQKINKTSNCVILRYPPLGLAVRMQKERQRSLNRFLALRELVDQIEMKISPETSPRLKEMEKIRKQKARRQRRSSSAL
jgi:peptide chain release factor